MVPRSESPRDPFLAEADIRTRRANLTSAQSALASPPAVASQVITVTSPAPGVATHLSQQSGRTVTIGTQLVEIGDTTGLEAAIESLSQDAVKIRSGQKAEIYNWGGPTNIPAEVRRVEPQGFTKVSALRVEEQPTLVILQFTALHLDWPRARISRVGRCLPAATAVSDAGPARSPCPRQRQGVASSK